MYVPFDVAKKVSDMGADKTSQQAVRVILAAILAGVYIGLGYYTNIESIHLFQGNPIGRVVGSLLFPTGLLLVLFTGAQLFTGNCLLTLGYLENRYPMIAVLRNWAIVYIGNFIGSIFIAFLIKHTGLMEGSRLATLEALIEPKISMTFIEAFSRGFLCNVLVAIAVYVSFASKSAIGQIASLWFPVSLFVLAGFEHSVANMFILPLGYMSGIELTIKEIWMNKLLPVTFGNMAGGGLFIPLFYYRIFLHGK